MTHTHYGLEVIELESGEYAIGKTEEEIKQAVNEYLDQSVWTFKAEFISKHLIDELKKQPNIIEVLKLLLSNCEDGNDAVITLLKSMEDFKKDAIESLGVGHFLASYDSEQKSFSELDVEDRRQLKKQFDKEEVYNYTFFRIN